MPIEVNVQGAILEFPDNASQEAIQAGVSQFLSQQAQPQPQVSPVQQPVDTTGMTIAQLNALERSQELALEAERIRAQGVQLGPVEGVIGGIGAGMQDVGRGIANLLLPEAQEVQDPNAAVRQRIQEANPISFGIGEFVGETVATAPLGGLAGGIAGRVAVGAASKVGAGKRATDIARLAFGGAAEGATVAAQLQESAGTGAVIGAGANMALPVVFRAGNSVFQRLTGKTATKNVFDEATGELTEAAAKELTDAGIPIETFAGEVETLVKQNFTPEIDLAAQTRQAQLQEFAPEAQARPSRLSQDFAAQNAEESLVTMGTPEGRNITMNEQALQEQLQQGARDKLLGGFDTDLIANFQTVSNDANKGLFGESVKNAVTDLEKVSKANVRALYSSARELAGGGTPVPAKDLRLAFELTTDEFAPQDSTINAVGKALKEFSVISEGDELFDTFKISEARKIKNLTLDNAEELRQRLNKLDPRDGSQDSAFISIIRQSLDGQVDGLINEFPEGSASAEAFKKARAASAAHKTAFNEKELVGKMINFKRGTAIDAIPEEKVLDVLMNSDKRSVQKIKQLMLEGGDEQSRQAWNEMKFTTIDELLRSSMNRQTGDISGQRLTNRMASIGDERLKLLLGNDKFNQLKRFERVIKDQTIPIRRLENPSGTAGTLAPMLSSLGDLMRGAANVSTGGVVDSVGKTAKNRSIIEAAIKESQQSIGRSARAKSIKARKQLGEFFRELIAIGAVVGASEE